MYDYATEARQARVRWIQHRADREFLLALASIGATGALLFAVVMWLAVS